MKKYRVILGIASLVFFLILITACTGGHDLEKVREKIKDYHYQEYGEEFIVGRIGTQKLKSRTDYVATVYPKSKLGKNGERDNYYSSQAGVVKKSFGRLGPVGSGYDMVEIKIQAEEYLISKAKEIFGRRIKLKSEVKYKKKKEGNDYFSLQFVSGFEKLLKKARTNPEKHRIELELYLYIFDRIEDEAEKEKRREEIFEFVQYLKEESLFKYLELGVIFMDERVLAESYDQYQRKIFLSDRVIEEIEGEKLYMPPMELRRKISKELQKEVNSMSEKELLENMREIKKSELSYKGINKNNAQISCYIYSPRLVKEKYETALKKGILKEKRYLNLSEILIENEREYIYIK